MVEEVKLNAWCMSMSVRPRGRQGELQELQESPPLPLHSHETPGGATTDVRCRLYFHTDSAE